MVASKVLAIFLVGWAIGGYLFGFIGDKIGRVKALSLSILTYAVFTGLTGLANNVEQFAVLRFLTGLGIGGEWAVGVTLLAESVSPKNRIMSTAFLATGFPLGYLLAATASYFISPYGWRFVFLFGVIPAFLVFFIRRKLKEPEAWTSVQEKVRNPFEIFSKKHIKNVIFALLLGITFSLGAWGCVIFWLPIWVERTLGGGLNEKTIIALVLMSTHVVGCYLAGPFFIKYKRRTILFWSYFLSFLCAGFMYGYFKEFGAGVLVFAGLLGFVFGAIPAGFAIYFPELFPTKIRSTAEGFCYNTGRLLTAAGVLYSGYLVQAFGGNIGYAASVMAGVFLAGAVVSLFVPETDKDLLPT